MTEDTGRSPKSYYSMLGCDFYSFSIDNTFERPIRISSSSDLVIFPSRFTNRFSEIERIWKQSAEEFLVSPFLELASILTIQGATSYLWFQSVKGTIIFKGSLPKESSFTIMAGRVFFISAPIVGSRLINQISPYLIKVFKIKVSKCC